jgi:hypothetical protein
MNEIETKDQLTDVSIPEERTEYVPPKLEQHHDYRILIAGGGSL